MIWGEGILAGRSALSKEDRKVARLQTMVFGNATTYPESTLCFYLLGTTYLSMLSIISFSFFQLENKYNSTWWQQRLATLRQHSFYIVDRKLFCKSIRNHAGISTTIHKCFLTFLCLLKGLQTGDLETTATMYLASWAFKKPERWHSN